MGRRVHGDRSLNLQRIFFLSLLKNCNHKRLGIYYLLSAFIFGISGTLISVLIRIELYSSGNRIISPENQNFYNVSITLHGLLMIFFLVMPGLFGGFGNYFAPVFQGSPEVVYPRINNFSILILFPSYLLLILSLISEFGGGTGWTLYPPLSTSFMSLSPSSIAFMVFGLLMSGISSCLTSLNFWDNAFISLEISSSFLIYFSLFSFILAWTFISLQIKEFRIMGLSINDSVYSCLFFFLTGLHFFHLLLGVLLLGLFFWGCSLPSKISVLFFLRVSEVNLFYNLQLFYWHFLEILWLFIL